MRLLLACMLLFIGQQRYHPIHRNVAAMAEKGLEHESVIHRFFLQRDSS